MGQNDLYDFKSFLSFCSNICTVSTGLWVFFFSVVSPFLSFQINNRGKKTPATLWNHIWHLLSWGLGYFRTWFMFCAFICQLLHLAEALLCDWGPMTLNNGHDVVLQNIRTMLTSWNVNYPNFTQVDIDIKKKTCWLPKSSHFVHQSQEDASAGWSQICIRFPLNYWVVLGQLGSFAASIDTT